MHRILIIPPVWLLAWTLGGCVSMTKRAEYDPYPPVGREGIHREGGIVYYLKIKPDWKYKDSELLLSSMNKAGPPYRIGLEAFKKTGDVRTFRITKILISMPDETIYDVLKGEVVNLPASKRNPGYVSYRSPELPLKFEEGAKVGVEIHCEADGRHVQINGAFVGRKGRKVESIWEEYGSL